MMGVGGANNLGTCSARTATNEFSASTSSYTLSQQLGKDAWENISHRPWENNQWLRLDQKWLVAKLNSIWCPKARKPESADGTARLRRMLGRKENVKSIALSLSHSWKAPDLYTQRLFLMVLVDLVLKHHQPKKFNLYVCLIAWFPYCKFHWKEHKNIVINDVKLSVFHFYTNRSMSWENRRRFFAWCENAIKILLLF